jgi:Txe/YoeB family toxin of Txe-Axe toxin-antitoxin module
MSDSSVHRIEKQQLEAEILKLKRKIDALKISYEQYFLDIFPNVPEREHNEVKRLIRSLSTSPFKNAGSKFKLQQQVARLNTFEAYWSRTITKRENGTYSRDQYKRKLKQQQLAKKQTKTTKPKSKSGVDVLYDKYKQAVAKTGSSTPVSFDAFKHSLIKQSKEVKAKTGAASLKYQIVTQGGQVSVKAVAKK